MQSITSISPILKYKYLPGIRKLIEKEQFITNEMEKRQQVVPVGYEFQIKMKTGFSEGINFGTYNSILPTARQSKYDTTIGTTKIQRGRIRIYRQLQDYTRNDEFAYLDVAMDEMDGIQDAMKCEKERISYGDAGYSPLCCIASVAVTNETDTWVTITVDDGGGVGLSGSTKYLRPGMPIDILSSIKATIDSSCENIEVYEVVSNTVFTVNCDSNAAADTLAALLADGNTIYHADGLNAEYNGLKNMFGMNSNTILGADRSTTAKAHLRPYVTYVNSSGDIVEGTPTGTPVNWSTLNIHEVFEYLVNTKHASESDLYAFCDKGVAAQLIQLRKAEGSYHEEQKTIDGWPYAVLEFEGRPVLSPRYMLSNSWCWVPMDQMEKYECTKLDFVDYDGDIWKWVSDYDAYESYLVEAMEMGCKRFDQGGWIGDLISAYATNY